jgi:hypothetical protein
MVIQQSMQGLLPCNTLLPPLRVLITGDFFNTHRRLHSKPRSKGSMSVTAMFRHSTQMRSQQVQHLEYEHAYDEGGNE